MGRTATRFTALLLLLAPVSSALAQTTIAHGVPVTRNVAAPPAQRSFAYPQSLFVDSQNGNIWVADFDNNRILRFDVSSLTGAVDAGLPPIPEEYDLSQNYPNPFNPSTTIRFRMRNTGQAKVTVYDLLGRELVTLFDGTADARRVHSLSFDGGALPSGVYFYSLRSGERTEFRKMALIR